MQREPFVFLHSPVRHTFHVKWLIYFIFLPKFYFPTQILFLDPIFLTYVCIRGVFILTTECPSLIVTLVVTLRKFFSLVFSILYFKNPFTLYHWLGTACVFGGTLLFTGIFHMARDALFPPRKTKKVE